MARFISRFATESESVSLLLNEQTAGNYFLGMWEIMILFLKILLRKSVALNFVVVVQLPSPVQLFVTP